ncbi:ankyrin [Penicillium pulvis]|uniref:ankyrin n=1 Tax=Penicillium pulvis TaxID=1562058 RepID=UPI0025482D1E|nr:ankyrin [Penicillium pulvis]KAJ5809327.1 ankyrin [Penicillium pulvis]
MALTDLPREVILCIADHLKRKTDIWAFTRVSRVHYHCLLNYFISRFRHSLLDVALENVWEDLLRKVLRTSIDINHQSEDDFETPLSRATYKNQRSIVEILLEREDINIHCKGGLYLGERTPLQYATETNREEIMRMLLGHAKMDIRHASDALWIAVNNRNLRPMEVLLDFEVDPNRTVGGRSLLETTVRSRLYGMRKLLIQDERVNLNCALRTGEGDEPIVLAMMKMRSSNYLDQLTDLFKQRARISFESSDHQGNTALHLMTSQGHLQWCEYLLQRYPEMPFKADKHGKLPVFEAVSRQRVDICKLFLKHCAISFQTPDAEGKLLVFEIFRAGNLVLFKAVLDCLGKELLRLREHNGRTLLAEVAVSGDHALVTDLISLGADPNKNDKEGYTPLMLAVSRNHVQVVEALLGIDGIDTDQVDEKGWTAYVWAKFPPPRCKRLLPRYKAMEDMLVAKGASKGRLDNLKRVRWPRKMWYPGFERRSLI